MVRQSGVPWINQSSSSSSSDIREGVDVDIAKHLGFVYLEGR
jgi:hypothetical protein